MSILETLNALMNTAFSFYLSIMWHSKNISVELVIKPSHGSHHNPVCFHDSHLRGEQCTGIYLTEDNEWSLIADYNTDQFFSLRVYLSGHLNQIVKGAD